MPNAMQITSFNLLGCASYHASFIRLCNTFSSNYQKASLKEFIASQIDYLEPLRHKQSYGDLSHALNAFSLILYKQVHGKLHRNWMRRGQKAIPLRQRASRALCLSFLRIHSSLPMKFRTHTCEGYCNYAASNAQISKWPLTLLCSWHGHLC